MLSSSYYKQKKNFLYPLECRQPDGCIKLMCYLDTKRKYTKKWNKNVKVFWVLSIQNVVKFKKGPGMDAALNVEK